MKRITTCVTIVIMLMLGGIFNTLLASVPMRLSESDSGKTVEMFVGDELEVVLPGKPTTGYVWEVSALDSTSLKQGKTDFIADTNAIGAGGMEIFRFKAIAVGRSGVKLIFHRPFEQNVPTIKTFEVTVIIKN
jgi:inhibitor of cysteine peptidase